MVYAVKCLTGVSEDKDARDVGTVSIMDHVLDKTAVGKARVALLAGHLGNINQPWESSLESICKAACKDLIDDGAHGDRTVVRKELVATFLMDEGGN